MQASSESRMQNTLANYPDESQPSDTLKNRSRVRGSAKRFPLVEMQTAKKPVAYFQSQLYTPTFNFL